jgi:hypothetical protein
MRVPESAKAFVESLNRGRINIAVLPAGSSPERIYPAAAWWRLALSILGHEFPSAHFFLTGKIRSDDRSSILAFSPIDISRITSASDRIFTTTTWASGISWHCWNGATC